jgi:hypothetical protein
MSWKPEVKVQGEWSQNGLAFETEWEAAAYASDLFSRWTMTEGHRAVESDAPVSHEWREGSGLRSLPDGEFRFPARSVSL